MAYDNYFDGQTNSSNSGDRAYPIEAKPKTIGHFTAGERYTYMPRRTKTAHREHVAIKDGAGWEKWSDGSTWIVLPMGRRNVIRAAQSGDGIRLDESRILDVIKDLEELLDTARALAKAPQMPDYGEQKSMESCISNPQTSSKPAINDEPDMIVELLKKAAQERVPPTPTPGADELIQRQLEAWQASGEPVTLSMIYRFYQKNKLNRFEFEHMLARASEMGLR